MKRVTVGLLLALCSATLLMGCGSGTDTVTADSAVEKSENATVDDAAEDESEDTSTGDENAEGTTSEGTTADDADEEDAEDDTAAQDELSDNQSENVDDEADKDTNKSGVRTEAKGLHISVNHMQGTLSEKKIVCLLSIPLMEKRMSFRLIKHQLGMMIWRMAILLWLNIQVSSQR